MVRRRSRNSQGATRRSIPVRSGPPWLHTNSAATTTAASNAANDRALSFVSAITVNSGATLRSSANALFGWDGTQERPITVNTGGTLTADGGATGDVGVGTVTLAGGTLI